jgi:hypothetical protein
VLVDEVPANGETWFLGECFARLRNRVVEDQEWGDEYRLRGVVSFSDPVARVSADGLRIFPGHIGLIYQAFKGVYLGRSVRRTLRAEPPGAAVPVDQNSLNGIAVTPGAIGSRTSPGWTT